MHKIFLSILWISFLPLTLMAQEKKLHADDLYDLGEQAHDAGKNREAIEYFDQCLKVNSGFTRAYFMRGSAKERLNDLHGAFADYSIYLKLKPEDSEALMSRAQVQYKQGYYEAAKEDFLKLLTLPRGETTVVLFKEPMSADGSNQIMTMQTGDKSYLYNYIGLSEYKLHNYKVAIEYFDKAIGLQGKDADYFVNRGLAKEAVLDSTAQSDYERALSINHNHTLAMNNLATFQSKKGDKSFLEKQLSLAIESDSTVLHPYLQRARHRFETENYTGALDDYTRALQIDSLQEEIWLGRGSVKEKLSDTEGAYDDYTKALDLNERYEKAWLNRANVLGKLGHYAEAIEDYSVVITYNENYGAAYYNRAMARQRLKQNTEACEDLKHAELLGIKVDAKVKAEICN